MVMMWDGSLDVRARRSLLARVMGLLGVSGLLAGCALDTRTLELAAGSGNDAGSGGTGSAISGGGSRPPDAVDLPVCAYGAGSPVPAGCETIAENAGFTKDVEGWNPEAYSIEIGWDVSDAAAEPNSGSIAVTNTLFGTVDGLAPGAGAQCIRVTPGATYDMAGDVYIPDGQGEGMAGGGPYLGEAGLSVLFWPNVDCSDIEPTHGNFQTKLVSQVGAWVHVEGAAVAPDIAKAMSLRVLTVKPFKQFKFQALFDNVLLRRR